MSMRGIVASMTIEEATDGDIFLAYVEHILCPALKPGDVVVMDNLSSHKIKGVRQRIEKVGAEVLYLPAYFSINALKLSRRLASSFERRAFFAPGLPPIVRTDLAASLAVTQAEAPLAGIADSPMSRSCARAR
jgi:hypothetical protein